jgi:hypothetical protein
MVHPGAETEIPSFGNNLTKYQPFSSLGENKNAMPLLTQPKQEFVKNSRFARCANQSFYRSFDCYIFNISEMKMDVATLCQLHNKVLQ